jgi:hypothetical protein
LVKQIETRRIQTKTLYPDYSIAPSYPATSPVPQAAIEPTPEIGVVQELESPISNGHAKPEPLAPAVERQPSRMLTDTGSLTPAELAEALRELRDTVIAQEIENWQPHCSILREAMIETLIARRVTDPDDWFHGVPQFQRTATNPIEKKRYFERIYNIVARMMPLETARSAPQAERHSAVSARLAKN